LVPPAPIEGAAATGAIIGEVPEAVATYFNATRFAVNHSDIIFAHKRGSAGRVAIVAVIVANLATVLMPEVAAFLAGVREVVSAFRIVHYDSSIL
jgi:isopentenyl phosphate kinase